MYIYIYVYDEQKTCVCKNLQNITVIRKKTSTLKFSEQNIFVAWTFDRANHGKKNTATASPTKGGDIPTTYSTRSLRFEVPVPLRGT